MLRDAEWWLHRGADGCLCCASRRLDSDRTLTSLFLSRTAWNGPPELTWIHRCLDCDFRFYDRGLSDAEAATFYADYRTDAYFERRHADEPFYTRKVHDAHEQSEQSAVRRVALANALERGHVAMPVGSVLDFGGRDGRLISDLPANRRTVFDLAAETSMRAGIEVVSADQLRPDWDLVVCAQTLEHVSDPLATVQQLLALTRPGGSIFLEVPNELWKSATLPGRVRNALLRLASRSRLLFIAMDIYSTGFRVKTGVIPPFGFIPMREHLNYFTRPALDALIRRAGGEIMFSALSPTELVAVARKPS